MESQKLRVEWVPTERLYLNPANPRANDDAVPHVAASIQRFGWQQPVVAKPTGEVIAGNTRLKAAQSLGLKEVPVVWFEGSDLEAVAYGIADNRTHEFSAWNEAELVKILEELRREDALDAVGYTSEEINALIDEITAELQPEELDDPGPMDPPEEPVTRSGDLWRLGEHRLLCGNSTKQDDIARVLGGEKAVLLSTDPPYCVDYTGMDRPVHEGKPSGKDWSHVYHEVDIKDLGEFLDLVFRAVLPHVVEDAAVYLWHAHLQYPVIAATFEKHDLLLHQSLIWVKPTATFGHSYYRWRHEPCAFGWRRGHKPKHGYGDMDSVWEVDWEGKQRITTFHPTSKPTRLFEIPLEQHTRPGALVLEPFAGSGSQLIAAEKLHRRCAAMELEPAFVDGSIERWEKATGKAATLDGTSKAFAEVAQERGKVQAGEVP